MRKHRTRNAARRAKPREPRPVLLTTRERSREIVVAFCRRAQSVGVRAGMTLAHARALLQNEDALVSPHAPSADAAQLRRLARWALRFSPAVTVDEPDGLFLDISGCAHLWDDEPTYLRAIADALEQLGFPARLATAPTSGAAWALARFGREPLAMIDRNALRSALAPLPIAALRLDRAALSALAEVDVQFVADVLAIPRTELGARFGSCVLERIDAAIGRRREPIARVTDRADARAFHEFDGPITRYDIVERTVGGLLSALIAQLEPRDEGVLCLEVHFKRTDADPVRIALPLACPSLTHKHLSALLGPKLERVNFGFGVEAICVRAARTGRMRQEQMSLWPRQTTNVAALGELLDNLTARLGEDGAQCIDAVETHVPERAFAFRPATIHEKRRPPLASVAGEQRPTRLFDRPEPARVISLVPDGPPVWLQWRGETIHVRAGVGPGRIAPPWWTDGDRAARDYHAVQDQHGRWLWVFRDLEQGRWFVQGEWA